MDFPAAPTPTPNPELRRAAVAAVVIALALYTGMLVTHVAALPGGSDTSGYMNHARLLGSGSLHAQTRAIPGLPRLANAPMLYVPLGFTPAWNGDGLVPTYPVGLPLFILAMKPLVGWRHAGDATILLHALAGLAAMYALGRALGLGRPWAILGTAILALSPLYVFMSLQAMSDVPSLLWTTLAVLAALRSRGKPAWALAAGAAIAVDVLLRPTNVLAFAPLAVALGVSPRRWLLLVLGGLPGAAVFFAHNLSAYGGMAVSGYGDMSAQFGTRYIPGTLVHYLRWLPVLFTPLVALGLGLPWLRTENPRTRWLLGTWILVYAAFYATYRCTHETWWYLRFLLPAAPALVAAALLVARTLLGRAPAWADPGRSPTAFALALAVAALALAWPSRTLHPFSIKEEELRYRELSGWMRTNVPGDAVCLASQVTGALYFDTPFTFVRWEQVNKDNVGRIESAIRAARLPLYAVLFPYEIKESDVLRKVMPGRWIEVGQVEDIVILRRDFAAAKP
jgi:hypothetical protein